MPKFILEINLTPEFKLFERVPQKGNEECTVKHIDSLQSKLFTQSLLKVCIAFTIVIKSLGNSVSLLY